ncbi:hypothetical protein [uncultured Prevotella sp.]|uniref:hypothetical protein n=1 Tax=uncultured Prevotella sp. TaxID=159272 RepID=UPI00261B9078|nr:hypothetical protein [uncultured Prevotella sp.]
MKMKKEYISPSIQVLQIESENILSGSDPNDIPGMPYPSEPGKPFYDYEDEEY